MKRSLVKLEYKKMWNYVSITAVAAMFVLSALHTFLYLNLQWRAIDQKGDIVDGLSSYRVLKEASVEIEGVMDGEYLQNLQEKYAVSADKKYLDENRGFLGTGGMTKYMFPNYCVNYASFSQYMSNGNDKMGLDYEYLNSEETFYRKFREAAKEQILNENRYNGMIKYTDSQISALEQKLAEMNTPFRVAYCQGLSNLMNWYDLEYPVFFILLAFALSSIYAKDSINGVDELTLSAAKGRKEDFRARWLAGNLFAASVYLAFIGILIVWHGAVATLHGFGASAQTYWFNCIFNISIGEGLILKFFGGLLGALVMANFTMLLSCILKNSKATAIAAVIAVAALKKLSGTYSQVKLLYPLQFCSDAAVKSFFFCGDVLIPYIAAVLLLTMIYAGIFTFFIWRAGKKYR